MSLIDEDQVEQIAIDWFKELEYDYLNGYDIAPDGDNIYNLMTPLITGEEEKFIKVIKKDFLDNVLHLQGI